jgi:hypothetical protein
VLGWVTRGTRPKKPSSSRGFAREARGARGVWGVWGIENRKPKIEEKFSLSKPATTTKKKFFYPRGRARVCVDAGPASTWTRFLPRRRTVKTRPRVKPRLRGKRGRVRTSGR